MKVEKLRIKLMQQRAKLHHDLDMKITLKGVFTPWRKIGEFETVGELIKLLQSFDDMTSLGFLNQPRQDLYYRVDRNGEGMLGFQ